MQNIIIFPPFCLLFLLSIRGEERGVAMTTLAMQEEEGQHCWKCNKLRGRKWGLGVVTLDDDGCYRAQEWKRSHSSYHVTVTVGGTMQQLLCDDIHANMTVWGLLSSQERSWEGTMWWLCAQLREGGGDKRDEEIKERERGIVFCCHSIATQEREYEGIACKLGLGLAHGLE